MSKISQEAYKTYGKVYKLWKYSTGTATVGNGSYGKNPTDFNLAKRYIRENWYMQLGYKCPWVFEEVSGNRRHRLYYNKFTINTSKGWQSLNHIVCHYICYKKYPELRQHCTENAWSEYRGAELIVKKYLPLNDKLDGVTKY